LYLILIILSIRHLKILKNIHSQTINTPYIHATP
jgi:hypothetical protein